MVKEIYFHNGRRTWGVNTTEVIKALEKQFGSKVKTIGGKPFAHRSSSKTKAPAKTTPKRNISRDRKYVSNEAHELAYNRAHPSKRTGYKGVKKAKRGMHVVGTKDEYDAVIPAPKFKKGDKAYFDEKEYVLPEPHWFAYMKEYSYKLPGKGEIVLEYELQPIKKANPGLLIAMELQKQKAEKDAKKQEFKDAHGGKEQWELDIPKEYQAKHGAKTSDRDQKFYDLVSELMNENPGMKDTVAIKNAYDELGYYPKYANNENGMYKTGGKTPGSIEYDTKPIKGQAKTHKKNTHFAFHKPSKSMVFSWDYKGYERDELYSYGGDDYFWTDVKDQVDYMVDKFRKQDFEIVTRQALSKKGYDLDDYKVFEGQKYDKAKKGKKTTGKTEYLVMNDTDGITASQDSFKTKALANKFIKAFPKRYEAQGYYRTNTWEKIDPKDVKLSIVEIDPNKLEFGAGGVILAGLIGAYVGYKVGRAKPQKKGFDTEKKYAERIKRKAGETAQAYKERKNKTNK